MGFGLTFNSSQDQDTLHLYYQNFQKKPSCTLLPEIAYVTLLKQARVLARSNFILLLWSTKLYTNSSSMLFEDIQQTNGGNIIVLEHKDVTRFLLDMIDSSEKTKFIFDKVE